MLRIAIIGALFIGLAPTAAMAEKYSVSLTRKEQNFYKVDGQDFYVVTKYCYKYAYSENVIIDIDAREVIFTGSSPTKCDLDMILQKVG